jgi:hypothetical protein
MIWTYINKQLFIIISSISFIIICLSALGLDISKHSIIKIKLIFYL